MEYPDEIYIDPEDGFSCRDDRLDWRLYGDEIARIAEHAYDIGHKHSTDFGDWRDLTAAIKAGDPIDWEALDGRRAKCVHESGVEAYHKFERHKFERDIEFPADTSGAHHSLNCYQWHEAFASGWHGDGGWTLYIDGPIPLKRKTADQLESGTCFKGNVDRYSSGLWFITYEWTDGTMYCILLGSRDTWEAKSVGVVEEYGHSFKGAH